MAELVTSVDQKHGKPEEGMECACCMDDIDQTNYVEYRSGEGKTWLPSLFCETCIDTLLKRQWSIYEDSLGQATCKAQQKRMLGDGPPTHIHDKKALPCPEGESVRSLWYMRDGQMHSSLLEGAPQGAARQIWWDEKLAFQFEEDDDEQAEEAKRSTQTSAPPNEPSTATAAAAGDSAVTGSDIMEVAEERRVENMNDVIESAEPASVANTDDDVDEPDAATALDHGTAEAYGSPQKVESMDETHTSASSSITSTEGSLEVP